MLQLVVSVKFTQFAIHSCKISRVDVGIQTYSVRESYTVYKTKMQNVKGGRWRYKRIVSVKYTQSTIQGCKISRVDVGVTNL